MAYLQSVVLAMLEHWAVFARVWVLYLCFSDTQSTQDRSFRLSEIEENDILTGDTAPWAILAGINEKVAELSGRNQYIST